MIFGAQAFETEYPNGQNVKNGYCDATGYCLHVILLANVRVFLPFTFYLDFIMHFPLPLHQTNTTTMQLMEIQQNNSRRRINTRVDLTAMVDLGFLLITFFMLATTFGDPYVMEVYKPTDGDPAPVPESKTATILLGNNDKLYTYTLPEELISLDEVHYDSIDYSASGLRAYIQGRQDEVAKKWGSKNDLLVIIKAAPTSTYKNLIDVLDEMSINGVGRYTMVDPDSPVDSMILRLR